MFIFCNSCHPLSAAYEVDLYTHCGAHVHLNILTATDSCCVVVKHLSEEAHY